MSNRFYPRWVKGNPQLRIFLPDFKMILIKPQEALPENVVTFKTDTRMTDWDIKNYLEKIYKIPVQGIRSRIKAGDLRNTIHGVSKHDDYKIAHVSIDPETGFKWPDLFPKEKVEEKDEEIRSTMEDMKKVLPKDTQESDIPTWFK